MLTHLHVHTTYSFLDGYGTPEQYVKKLKSIGQNSMAVTDHGNIYAHRTFDKIFRANDIKLIPGCEMYVKSSECDEKRYLHATVICKNAKGHENLCRLITLGNSEGHFRYKPLVSLDEIAENQDGLIILTGCFGNGLIHQIYLKNKEDCLKHAIMFRKMFSDCYLEIQKTTTIEELNFFRLLSKLSGLPTCPTFDVHYPDKSDYPAEDLAFCIGQKAVMSDATRRRLFADLYLMEEKEALEHFTAEEIARTQEIADKCDVSFPKLCPVRLDNDRVTMIRMVEEGSKRLGEKIKNSRYRERYQYELSVIDKLGLHSYFVIMGDVISEFKRRGAFIGPARGSSAGSLIAYLIGITEVDPLAYALSFERFIDINRRDYPDIDTDFPQGLRGSIVHYLQTKYGGDRVGRITSYTRWSGASVFWDVARAYSVDRDIVSKVTKDIPNLVNDSIDMKGIMEIPSVIDLCRKHPCMRAVSALEGQIRHLGKHASGYAISPVDISSILGFNRAGDELVISADKAQSEDMGLIKLDLLGLVTLDMIQSIMRDEGIKNGDLYNLKPDDPKVFELFNKGEVAGIFQFEGAAAKAALRTVPVSSLEDLAFINAVCRPGAINSITGKLPVPEIFRQFIYKGKYFVYQEELMAILRFLGFDWDDVTKIRKMVSKKQVVALNEKYHGKFVSQAVATRMVTEKQAQEFWVVINQCGEYMFNKSHAVSYAFLAYISMWLKMYHKNSFIKSYMNIAEDDSRRELLRECVRIGYTYRQPTESDVIKRGFSVVGNEIIGGLESIKGIGPAKAMEFEAGKRNKGTMACIEKARKEPEKFAPWAALDDFGNKRMLGNLPEGDYIVRARAWAAKDGVAYVEDINGCEKCYYNPRFVNLKEGEVYDLAITKWKYAKIDSARRVK